MLDIYGVPLTETFAPVPFGHKEGGDCKFMKQGMSIINTKAIPD